MESGGEIFVISRRLEVETHVGDARFQHRVSKCVASISFEIANAAIQGGKRRRIG